MDKIALKTDLIMLTTPILNHMADLIFGKKLQVSPLEFVSAQIADIHEACLRLVLNGIHCNSATYMCCLSFFRDGPALGRFFIEHNCFPSEGVDYGSSIERSGLFIGPVPVRVLGASMPPEQPNCPVLLGTPFGALEMGPTPHTASLSLDALAGKVPAIYVKDDPKWPQAKTVIRYELIGPPYEPTLHVSSRVLADIELAAEDLIFMINQAVIRENNIDIRPIARKLPKLLNLVEEVEAGKISEEEALKILKYEISSTEVETLSKLDPARLTPYQNALFSEYARRAKKP